MEAAGGIADVHNRNSVRLHASSDPWRASIGPCNRKSHKNMLRKRSERVFKTGQDLQYIRFLYIFLLIIEKATQEASEVSSNTHESSL